MSEFVAASADPSALAFPHTNPIGRMIGALRAIFVSSSTDARPARRHYPPLLTDAEEHSAMAREMYRL
ncbi:hypothetical protein ACWDUD_01675 [Rhodococcus sp. NPDC003382]|uniref:hypothetical protein n=1 Tax=unclassified Rhodococcus (in: high G+C Gram-positive bacteria) TaxID=192944 RepID=UPI0018CD58E6|nr:MULTISPECIES: hypothetical protein [unclassified Rhodococcus (in: high G+C Gram-positive bacteria)]MBH0118996.1 hypothetical protein [Rhodococcus sp. CX]MCK8673414.1 hypothetical protein [Rhodococcus sp. HM1]